MNRGKRKRLQKQYERGEALYQRLLRGWKPASWSDEYRVKVLEQIQKSLVEGGESTVESKENTP